MPVAFAGRCGARWLAGPGLAALVILATPAAAQQPAPFKMGQAEAPAAAPAPEPSAEQLKLANELLVANGEASSFDSLIPGVIEQAAGSFVQANPDLIRDLREVAQQLVPQYENRRAEIIQILARTYAAQFSVDELNQLLTFYRSPVGHKLVAKRQQILDDGLRNIQAWSVKLSQEVEGRVRAEMKKRGFTI
ncbi:DUF2059 domain-containing protein [Ancylobacter mangrovi]|uniref:DUF2059 domain-containing protein n=1 Tax=Ancylobacter mangrovi TaxID=2972472 RepID=A0A9X2PE38_9HYPH|nr:DUF2059 domain-containing protein [Ancylobacter mangrovi]MCS0493922.1 DUF2059 domain-containing protein [Ancylobacter mangrovi]MCS0501313.1 DUF2059 domain-containing protein [Ancylobacter mangrovi]